jgi:uncharacterized MnhB-related membrane protein
MNELDAPLANLIVTPLLHVILSFSFVFFSISFDALMTQGEVSAVFVPVYTLRDLKCFA